MIDSNVYVSEFTKKTLEQFGWVVGDPVPTNLSAVLDEVKSRTPATKKMGVYVDAELMTESDIAAIKKTLADAKVAVADAKKQNAINKATDGFDPQTAALYAKIAAQENENAPQIIDDRETAPTVKPDVTVAEPAPTPTPIEKLVEEVESDLPLINVAQPVQVAFCPRCNWDLRQEFNVEVTEADKEAFVAITLGGERFKKTYTILNGKYAVRFRSLQAEENTAIHHQLLLDQRKEEFLSDTEWFLRMFEYRMACSVEVVAVNDKPIGLVPELDDVPAAELPSKHDDKEKPALIRLRNYVVVELLKSEVTRRLVGSQFRQFQRLCETLEAMALEPNFW
jgi:hypothetical protein